MILGFKDQFAPFVENGSKWHSIRTGERWKIGMRADCYARPRQKGMRLLFRAPVVRVQTVHIEGGWEAYSGDFFGDIKVDGNSLRADERNLLAWRDGFRDIPAGPSDAPYLTPFQQMMEFWRERLPFHGQIIHWDYAKREVL